MKKLFILLVFMGIIPFSCCREGGEDFMKINTIQSQTYVNNQLEAGTIEVANTDSLKFEIIISDFNYVYKSQPSFSFNTYAYGNMGLKNKMDSIRIVSDQSYKGLSAGTNLFPFFSGIIEKHQDSITVAYDGDLAFVKDNYNVPSIINFDTFLLCNDMPTDQSSHQFKIQMYFDDQTFVETVTDTITFK